MTNEQAALARLAELRSLLEKALLSDEDLDAEGADLYGEDGSIDSFERGEKYGADDLARRALDILNGV